MVAPIVFDGAKNESTTRAPAMSVHDVYVGSLEQKKDLATATFQKAVAIYEAHQNGQRSEFLAPPASDKAAAKQNAALADYVASVDAALAQGNIDRASNPDGFNRAIRSAYRGMIENHGVERVNPALHGGGVKYDQWFKVYNKSFPIRGERETKSDMRDLVSEPMTDKGYGEVAIGLSDPLLGTQIGGVQALVVAQAAAGMFTYAFIDAAYQGFGFSHTLLNETSKVVSETVAQHNPRDKREPAIYLEKNKLSGMPIENFFLDSTGFDITKPPREGTNLAKGAISQSLRDGTWGALGAQEIKNAGYIQPSLDGVTRVNNPEQRALAIRYLQEDATLSLEQKEQASKVINDALGTKAAHCPLALCVFTKAGQTHVDLKQTQQFLAAFYQTSVLDAGPREWKQDIFADATMNKLALQADANGKLALIPITPYGGPISVKTFADAENVTRALLKVADPGEIALAVQRAKNGMPETPYSEWLNKYEPQIRAALSLQVGTLASQVKQDATPRGEPGRGAMRSLVDNVPVADVKEAPLPPGAGQAGIKVNRMHLNI